jgi:hypothetical protein
MTRRFTETDKWQDEWFLSLPFEAKLLFLYLCDNCDCAGFWEVINALSGQITADATCIADQCACWITIVPGEGACGLAYHPPR